MSKADLAVECFKKGFNCSQAVFSTYCESLGLDKETAMKVSCGLGGGMGRMGETCGAVSAAYLLIGLKYGQVREEDKELKDKTYATVREFAEKFKERNKSTQCKELIGVDFLTGERKAVSERLKNTCPKLIHDSAEIIEEMLQLNEC